MERYQTSTLKSIVTEDFRAAAVFEKFSLDFCCGGGVTVDQACRERNIDPAAVFADLARLGQSPQAGTPKFSSWPCDELIDYIVNVHHTFVRGAIPTLLAHTRKVASVHGGRHPELVAVAQAFESVSADLQSHMLKEEHVLFPYIRQLVQAKRTGSTVVPPPFGAARNPIGMMEAEHKAAGDEFHSIRMMTDAYTLPGDACTTYRITFQELRQFEEDLHQHIHLENNILFPMAVALEEELTTA